LSGFVMAPLNGQVQIGTIKSGMLALPISLISHAYPALNLD